MVNQNRPDDDDLCMDVDLELQNYKQSKGRQGIPIELIQYPKDLSETFSKHRLDLFKKTSELSTFGGVNIGVLIFSPTGVPYSFFSPTAEVVLEQYTNLDVLPDKHVAVSDALIGINIDELNKTLDEVRDQHAIEKQREKYLDEKDKTRQKLWWEDMDVEEMNKEQVTELKKTFKDVHARTSKRIEQLTGGF